MDPKQLLLAHFDKGIVGASALWLVFVLVGFANPPKELKTRATLQTDVDVVKEYVDKRKAKKAKVPNWEGELRKNLDGSGLASVPSYPSWVLHRRPNVVFDLPGGPIIQDPVHGVPVNVSLRPERGRITVTWEASSDNALINPTEYAVLRKTSADGKFEPLATVGGEDSEYVDKTVNPRSKYWYKIRSTAELDTEHPLVRKAKMTALKDDLKVRESDAVGPISTPKDTIIQVTYCQMPTDDEILANPDVKGKARIKIWKFDPDNAKKPWIYHQYNNVTVGTKIGKIERKRGGKKIDVSINGVLADVQTEKRDHPTIKGHKVDVFIIKIKFEGAEPVTITSADKNPELKKK